MKVAVVGGGIAGSGAAWSLKQAGHDVTIFEAEPALGGNAKTHEWEGSGGAVSGLSVLAWPPAYFRNYQVSPIALGYLTAAVRRAEPGVGSLTTSTCCFFAWPGSVSAAGPESENRAGPGPVLFGGSLCRR